MGLFAKKQKSPFLFKTGQAGNVLTKLSPADALQQAFGEWAGIVPWRQKELLALFAEQHSLDALIAKIGEPEYSQDCFLFWWPKLAKEEHLAQLVARLAAKEPLAAQVASTELLIALHDPRSLGSLLAALVQPLVFVASRVVECLTALGQIAALGLAALYDKSRPEQRRIILSSLSCFPDYLPQDLLLSALLEEELLQLAAIEGLLALPAEKIAFAQHRLLAIFPTSSWRVKAALADLFHQKQVKEAIPCLEGCLLGLPTPKTLQATVGIALQGLKRIG